MTKEQFIALGLTEEQAQKAAEESKKELESYVPKHRFDEVNTENKSLKTAAKESETALEELKKSAGSQQELSAQIQKMQEDAKAAEQKHQEELKEIRMTNAIKLAVAGKAQDDDLVAGLIDREKLILNDDGKVTGLEEQLKTLKENKAFLFREEKSETTPGFRKIGGEPPRNNQGTQPAGLKSAIAAFYQQEK